MSHPAQLSGTLFRRPLPHPEAWSAHCPPRHPPPAQSCPGEDGRSSPRPSWSRDGAIFLSSLPGRHQGTQAGPELRQHDAVPRSGAQNSLPSSLIWARGWGSLFCPPEGEYGPGAALSLVGWGHTPPLSLWSGPRVSPCPILEVNGDS